MRQQDEADRAIPIHSRRDVVLRPATTREPAFVVERAAGRSWPGVPGQARLIPVRTGGLDGRTVLSTPVGLHPQPQRGPLHRGGEARDVEAQVALDIGIGPTIDQELEQGAGGGVRGGLSDLSIRRRGQRQGRGGSGDLKAALGRPTLLLAGRLPLLAGRLRRSGSGWPGSD